MASTSSPGTGNTASTRNTASPQKSNQSGVIAGAVIGSLLVVALAVVGTIVYMRQRKKRKGQYSIFTVLLLEGLTIELTKILKTWSCNIKYAKVWKTLKS